MEHGQGQDRGSRSQPVSTMPGTGRATPRASPARRDASVRAACHVSLSRTLPRSFPPVVAESSPHSIAHRGRRGRAPRRGAHREPATTADWCWSAGLGLEQAHYLAMTVAFAMSPAACSASARSWPCWADGPARKQRQGRGPRRLLRSCEPALTAGRNLSILAPVPSLFRLRKVRIGALC